MKVLLVNPVPDFGFNWNFDMPFSCLALGSFLQTRGHEVRIWDRRVERVHIQKYIARSAPDAVCLSVIASTYIRDAMDVAAVAKDAGIPVIWGGHYATIVPEEILRSGLADWVGLREGEYTLLELLAVVAGTQNIADVLGAAYLDADGRFVVNPERPFANLADFPPLDYALLPDIRLYQTAMAPARHLSSIITSKGCPYQCTFCFNYYYHHCQLRLRPLELVFAEIDTLARDYGADGLMILDELFGVNKERLRAFCAFMREKHPAMSWFCCNAVGNFTADELKMMYAAGCKTISYGIESGSRELLARIKKNYDPAILAAFIQQTKDAGLTTSGSFIIGFPKETVAQLRETVHMVFRLALDLVVLNYFSVVPGSELFNELVDEGKITPAKTLQEVIAYGERNDMEHNYSEIPTIDLKVVRCFFRWNALKATTREGEKGSSLIMLKMALSQVLLMVFRTGVRNALVNLYGAAKEFLVTFWYAHAHPKIRKKYDLYRRNFGRRF
ncbi:MAG: B12-binding domain-containing radical SAM protein [Oscillospiraceae bacterium]|jgi:radical SAM superfamily enzyme YgiQ (UPF0313 family)|nr:B12-binding domain-containing radical SAM protein [Oscillospiraceae bacterium]